MNQRVLVCTVCKVATCRVVPGGKERPWSLYVSASQRKVLPQHSIVGGALMWEKSLSSVFADLQGLSKAGTGAGQNK